MKNLFDYMEDVPNPPKDYCIFENGATGYETRDDCGCAVCVTYNPYDFFTRDLD